MTNPSIIFMQETMVEEKNARAFMFSLCPSWLTCAVSVVGTSGGLLVSWNPNMFEISLFLCCGGILLTCTCLEIKQPVTLLNVYGPCIETKAFLEKVVAKGILERGNIILVGDLNLTCEARELWGEATHMDPLLAFFKDIFNKARLIDVALDFLVPTWRNG
jgi:hypothetical protein